MWCGFHVLVCMNGKVILALYSLHNTKSQRTKVKVVLGLKWPFRIFGDPQLRKCVGSLHFSCQDTNPQAKRHGCYFTYCSHYSLSSICHKLMMEMEIKQFLNHWYNLTTLIKVSNVNSLSPTLSLCVSLSQESRMSLSSWIWKQSFILLTWLWPSR